MNDDTDKKDRIAVDVDKKEMTAVEAIYIAALGAAKADGVVDDEENSALEGFASIFSQQEYLRYAEAYFGALKDNEGAINGALKVIAKSDQAHQMAAILYMKYILEKDGVNEAENTFYTNAVKKITNHEGD